MGVRLLPFLKGKKGWQFAGGGLSADGGGYVLPTASADTLGGVKVSDDFLINDEGVLTLNRLPKLLASVEGDGLKTNNVLINELANLLPDNFNFDNTFVKLSNDMEYRFFRGTTDAHYFMNASCITSEINDTSYFIATIIMSETLSTCSAKSVYRNAQAVYAVDNIGAAVVASGKSIKIYRI